MRRLDLETFGVDGEDLVEFCDGLIVLFLLVGDFAEIELSVGSEFGVAVELEVVLKFLAGEIVLAAGDVAKTIGIERVGGRRRASWSTGGRSGTAGRRRSEATAGVESPVDGVAAPLPEILASTLCTVFWRSTNC